MKLSFFVRYLDQAGIFRTRVELSGVRSIYLTQRSNIGRIFCSIGRIIPELGRIICSDWRFSGYTTLPFPRLMFLLIIQNRILLLIYENLSRIQYSFRIQSLFDRFHHFVSSPMLPSLILRFSKSYPMFTCTCTAFC